MDNKTYKIGDTVTYRGKTLKIHSFSVSPGRVNLRKYRKDGKLDSRDRGYYANISDLEIVSNVKINVMHNVGKTKYLVNYSYGKKKHKDGSEFFDIACFKNKNKMNDFITSLNLNNNG